MSRDKQYQHLLNIKRWKLTRKAYMEAHPLCEECLKENRYRAAVDCHHIKPVESATSYSEMVRLAYNLDGNNLKALCIPCHIKAHQQMHSHCKEQVAANKERARRRFLEMNDPNYEP